jgi:hypothetical protein
VVFALIYQAGELGGLNIDVDQAKQLEEWEAEGMLRRLHQVQSKMAEAKGGKTSLGGIDEEDAFETGSEQDQEDPNLEEP